ncbi:MAG: hypothetical protein QOE90_1697 [Thermoplasmata archaeon]|nr:hypothetical protein [Thermoplasmata archaeon]
MTRVRSSLAIALLLLALYAAPLLPSGRATPGDLVATATVPVPGSIGVSIAFDGHTFYYTNYQDPTLYGYTVACSGGSCATTLTLTEPIVDAGSGAHVSMGSMAYDATRHVLWAGADGSNAVYQIDPATGAATMAFTASACPMAGIVDGLGYDAINDLILYSPDTSHTVCEYTPAGSLFGTISIDSLVGFPGCYNSGVAIGGSVLYLGSDGCGQIAGYDRDSLASLGTFASPGGRDEGMTCDPVTFAPRSVIWSKDAYNNVATAFEIADGTCGVGGEPPCTPSIATTIDDPAPGFDYFAGGKVAQSPLQAFPRVNGVVTLDAHATGSAAPVRADFRVDGHLVGTATSAPFQIAWDSGSVAPGPHSLGVTITPDSGCPSTATQAFQVTCGAPILVAVSRPAAGTTYYQDIAHPGQPGPALVLGDITLAATASDPSRIGSVDWSIDGQPLATGLVGAPWSALWPASAASPGLHALTATFHETENAVCVDVATATARVSVLRQDASAQGVWIGLEQPAEPSVYTEPVPAPGSATTLDYANAAVGLEARAVVDDATTSLGAAHASSQVSDVSLLHGLVVAKLLRGEAAIALDASDLSFPADATGSHVAGLLVNGVPVTVSNPNTRVDLPGVGHLVLDERLLRDAPGHRELQVNALHLYVDHAGLRGEVVLGSAVVGLDDALGAFTGRAHESDPQDDAGSGGDAGDSRAGGLVLPVGQGGADLGSLVVGGRLGENDIADHYLVHVAQGEKIEATLKPAEAAQVGLGHVTPPPPPSLSGVNLDGSQIPAMELRLLEPSDGAVEVTSALPLSAPQRAELNVNQTGLWDLVVSGDAGNYTLSVSVVPAPLAPQAFAGAACGDANAPWLAASGVLSSMGGTDARQVWRLNASIGDDLAVELLMPDPDGQDLDLTLYDAACQVVAQSQNGKELLWPGDTPKGLSDLVAQLPVLHTQTYWVEVSRYLGAGNYLLQPQVGSAIPTAPGNDAMTGQDASNDANAPTPLPLPQGVFEGRFEDNDPADVYSVHLAAGERALVTFVPSPANTGHMQVSGVGVAIDRQEDVDGRAAFQLTAPAGQDVDAVIALTPGVGGGNYALAVVHK